MSQVRPVLIAVSGPIGSFTRRVLARAGWAPGHPVIVDGVRHQGAVTALRAIAAPLPVVVVYLDIPAGDGIARARHRDHLGALPPGHGGQHPVEQDLPCVRDLADLILPASTTGPGALAGRVLGCLGVLPVPNPEHGHA